VPLVIARAIVLVCAWLAWRYTESTQEVARSNAERKMQRLLYEHDAKYSPPISAQRVARLSTQPPEIRDRQPNETGVPTAQVKLAGSVSHGSDAGAQDPKAHFTSHVVYPADAHFYLDIARRNGLWQIDLFSFG
jgi:hypothetical protein